MGFSPGSTPRTISTLKYSIIIPAYNERLRIAEGLDKVLAYLREQKLDAEIIVVNDGSRDETPDIVRGYMEKHPRIRLLENPGNRGKGYSVRHGVVSAYGEYVLFSDADLSSPIEEAVKLFAAIEAGADVAIGSRWLDPSLQTQRQPLKRRILSRAYNIFLHVLLRFPYRDTQCGFKAFSRRSANVIFPMQRIRRWGFDSELLFLAHKLGFKVAEVPVIWGHDERSTIHPYRDGMRMGVDALKVCWYSLTGKYDLRAGKKTPAKA